MLWCYDSLVFVQIFAWIYIFPFCKVARLLPVYVVLTHQAVDHAQTSFAQVLGHLEDVHQLLWVCTVQKVPQGAEDSRAWGAITGRGNNHVCVNMKYGYEILMSLCALFTDTQTPKRPVLKQHSGVRVHPLMIPKHHPAVWYTFQQLDTHLQWATMGKFLLLSLLCLALFIMFTKSRGFSGTSWPSHFRKWYCCNVWLSFLCKSDEQVWVHDYILHR